MNTQQANFATNTPTSFSPEAFGKAVVDALLGGTSLDQLMASPGIAEKFGSPAGSSYTVKGGDTLSEALTDDGPTLAIRAPGAGEPRITFTLPRLLRTDGLYLHIEGEEKAAVLDTAGCILSGRQEPVTLHMAAWLEEQLRPRSEAGMLFSERRSSAVAAAALNAASGHALDADGTRVGERTRGSIRADVREPALAK